jgi:HEAT repeat protein
MNPNQKSGQIGDPRAVKPLKEAMSPHEHLGLYREAKQALEKIGD